MQSKQAITCLITWHYKFYYMQVYMAVTQILEYSLHASLQFISHSLLLGNITLPKLCTPFCTNFAQSFVLHKGNFLILVYYVPCYVPMARLRSIYSITEGRKRIHTVSILYNFGDCLVTARTQVENQPVTAYLQVRILRHNATRCFRCLSWQKF
jgi:hypothetical protein